MRSPLFGIGQRGQSVNITSDRRRNVYAEFPKDPDKGQLAFYGTPGCKPFAALSGGPTRGLWALGVNMYCVNRDILSAVNNAGTPRPLGSIVTSSGYVSMVDNGTQLLLVDGTYGWVYNTSTSSLSQVTSPDFPAGAKTCTWSDQYFIVEDGIGVQISALGDAMTWDATDRKIPESSADGIVRVMADHGELVVFGQKTIEFWINAPSGADFPYQRMGAGVAEWGLVAPLSLCKFAVREGESSMMLLARKSGMTNVQVCLIVGYTLKPVSTPELEAEINTYPHLEAATAFAYMDRGHPFYQINFTDANRSWLYDGMSGLWSERSTDEDRYLGEFGIEFLGGLKIADYRTGALYTLDANEYTDNGETIPAELDTRHMFDEESICIASLQLDVETGVGTLAEPYPQVMLKISKNGGHTWSSEIWRSIGVTGDYGHRVIWRRLGAARDWVARFRITDRVKRVFLGGWIEAEK